MLQVQLQGTGEAVYSGTDKVHARGLSQDQWRTTRTARRQVADHGIREKASGGL